MLNSRNWSLPLDQGAQFFYAPVFAVEDLDQLHVSVVPLTTVIEIVTRVQRAWDYEIGIALQQRVEGDDQRVENLLALGEEIADYFLALRNLTGYTSAAIVGAKFDPLFVEGHLQEARVFTGAVILTFRVFR